MADPKLEAQETRGRTAQAALDNPALKEAFDSVRDACVATFGADDLDPEQLLRVWLVYRLYLKLESHLKKAIREGADASKLLAEIAKRDAVNGQG